AFTWAAVRSFRGRSTQWLTCRRSTMRRHLLSMIAIIAAAGLAGCAGRGEPHVQFFKPYGSGPVEQRYLSVIVVTQTDQAPRWQKERVRTRIAVVCDSRESYRWKRG